MILSIFFSFCSVMMLMITSDAGPVGGIKKEDFVESHEPYVFGYKMDDGNGTLQHRQEVANENGEVKGKYGYTDSNGYYREVDYVAGENGFQVKIKSNEPGLSNQNSANVVYVPNSK